MKKGSIFTEFLRALGVPHTMQESDAAFEAMPFRTLFGFSRLLDSYHVPNKGVRFTDKSDLTTIPIPFLAQFGSPFVIVKGFGSAPDGEQGVQYELYGKTYNIPAAQFERHWTGVALLAYPDKESSEPQYGRHHLFELAEKGKLWILAACAVFLLLFGFISGGLWHNVSAICLLAVTLGGIYITWQLLLKSLKVNVKTADRICGILQKHGCDTVLEQKASKLFGLISWSEVGIGYFLVTLVVMLIFPEQMHYLALLNGCCLPFTVWSISYQKFKLKTWCTLCVITQGLLWLSFFCYFFGGWWTDIFPLRMPLFLIIAAYVGAVLGINRITTFINSRVRK